MEYSKLTIQRHQLLNNQTEIEIGKMWLKEGIVSKIEQKTKPPHGIQWFELTIQGRNALLSIHPDLVVSSTKLSQP